jgi:hypothetical protein
MWLSNCKECPNQTETEKIDLTIDVTKGMRPQERVTFEGVTDEKPGYKPGDLNFVIFEKSHNEYHRDGDHLYKTMEIPLVDALVSSSGCSRWSQLFVSLFSHCVCFYHPDWFLDKSDSARWGRLYCED